MAAQALVAVLLYLALVARLTCRALPSDMQLADERQLGYGTWGNATRWGRYSPTGHFLGMSAEDYDFDARLAAALGMFLVAEGASSSLDLGAGPGRYSAVLAALGVKVTAVDGNPELFTLRAREVGGGGDSASFRPRPRLDARAWASTLVDHHDLSAALPHREPGGSAQRFDWVLALEVAEHLPPKYEAGFLLNVHRHNARGVVISWAKRGQAGLGHVNCRDTEEVVRLFRGLGYELDRKATETLRQASEFPWYSDGLLVFRRRVLSTPCGEVEPPAAFAAAFEILGTDSLETPPPEVWSAAACCCGTLEAMQLYVRVSHCLACFSEKYTYHFCCEVDYYPALAGADKGNFLCFGRDVGFSVPECCNADCRRLAHSNAVQCSSEACWVA